MESLVLNHEGGLAEELDVLPPEDSPGLITGEEAEDEKLGWPENHPRAVGHVEHAKGLFPLQLVLNVDGRLGLHREADQTQDQQEGSVDVASPCLELGLRFWVSLIGRVGAGAEEPAILSTLIFALPVAQKRRV